MSIKTSLLEALPSIPEEEKEAFRVLSEGLSKRGFDDLDFIGQGSSARVFVPKDNADIVIRITKSPPSERKEIPYMLQRIGYYRVDTGHRTYGLRGIYLVEILKRLDMEVDNNIPEHRRAFSSFLADIKKHGYEIGSLGRGSEIGWYHYKTASGESRKVLMAVDPSALNVFYEESDSKKYTHEINYPSLAEQNEENSRLAKSDDRLAEFLPILESNHGIPEPGKANGIIFPHASKWTQSPGTLVGKPSPFSR